MPGSLAVARVRPAPSTLTRAVDGELVLLNLETSRYFVLDDVGTVIWNQLIAADGSVSAAIAATLADFEVERAQLEADTDRLVGELAAVGLVEIER